jgi:hypothetical protein
MRRSREEACSSTEDSTSDEDSYESMDERDPSTEVVSLSNLMDMLCRHSDNVFLDSMTELMSAIESVELTRRERRDFHSRLTSFISQSRDRLRNLERAGIPEQDSEVFMPVEETPPPPSSLWHPWALSKSLLALPFRALGAMRYPWRTESTLGPSYQDELEARGSSGELARPEGEETARHDQRGFPPSSEGGSSQGGMRHGHRQTQVQDRRLDRSEDGSSPPQGGRRTPKSPDKIRHGSEKISPGEKRSLHGRDENLHGQDENLHGHDRNRHGRDRSRDQECLDSDVTRSAEHGYCVSRASQDLGAQIKGHRPRHGLALSQAVHEDHVCENESDSQHNEVRSESQAVPDRDSDELTFPLPYGMMPQAGRPYPQADGGQERAVEREVSPVMVAPSLTTIDGSNAHNIALQRHLLERTSRGMDMVMPAAPFVTSMAVHSALPSGGLMSTITLLPGEVQQVQAPLPDQASAAQNLDAPGIPERDVRPKSKVRRTPPGLDATLNVSSPKVRSKEKGKKKSSLKKSSLKRPVPAAGENVVPPMQTEQSDLQLLCDAASLSARQSEGDVVIESEETKVVSVSDAILARRRAVSGLQAPPVLTHVFGELPGQDPKADEDGAKRLKTMLKTPAKSMVFGQTRPPREESLTLKPVAAMSLAQLFRASTDRDGDGVDRVLSEAKDSEDPHGIFVDVERQEVYLPPLEIDLGNSSVDEEAAMEIVVESPALEDENDHSPASADTVMFQDAFEDFVGADDQVEVGPSEEEMAELSRTAEASGDLLGWVIKQGRPARWVPEPLWLAQRRIGEQATAARNYRCNIFQPRAKNPKPGSFDEFRIPHDLDLSAHVARGEDGFPDVRVPEHLQAEARDWKDAQVVRMLNRAGRAAVPVPVLFPLSPDDEARAVEDYRPPEVPNWPEVSEQALARASFVTPLWPMGKSKKDRAKACVSEASSALSLPPPTHWKKTRRGTRGKGKKRTGLRVAFEDSSKLSEFQKNMIVIRTHEQLTLKFVESATLCEPTFPIAPRRLSAGSRVCPKTASSSMVPFPSVSGENELGFAILDSYVPEVPEEEARLMHKYLGNLLPYVYREAPGPPHVTIPSHAVKQYLIDLRPLVPKFSQVAADRELLPSPMNSVLAPPRKFNRTQGDPSFAASHRMAGLDYDFRAVGVPHDDKLRPPVSVYPEALQTLLGQARSRIVTTSAQDWNLSAVQSIVLHLLRVAEETQLEGEIMEIIQDLQKVLQASDVIWTEGMKLDAVMLANLSILQRDSYLALSYRMGNEMASRWRAQPFLSDRVFGLDDHGKRPLPFDVADRSLLLHLNREDVYRLQPADKVLLASEISFLNEEDVAPVDGVDE